MVLVFCLVRFAQTFALHKQVVLPPLCKFVWAGETWSNFWSKPGFLHAGVSFRGGGNVHKMQWPMAWPRTSRTSLTRSRFRPGVTGGSCLELHVPPIAKVEEKTFPSSRGWKFQFLGVLLAGSVVAAEGKPGLFAQQACWTGDMVQPFYVGPTDLHSKRWGPGLVPDSVCWVPEAPNCCCTRLVRAQDSRSLKCMVLDGYRTLRNLALSTRTGEWEQPDAHR